MKFKGNVLDFPCPEFLLAFEDFMERQKISRREIHRRSGIGETTISAWLAGSDPAASSMMKIAEVFGVSFADFLSIGKPLVETERQRQLEKARHKKAHKELGQRLAEEVEQKYKTLQEHYPEGATKILGRMAEELVTAARAANLNEGEEG